MINENEFFLHSIVLGAFITFVYDLIRIFRRVVPHGAFLVSLEDMAFWVYCGAEVFLAMYHESNGTLRWFSVVGAVAGIITYKKTLSPLLVKYVSLALSKILRVLGKAVRWVWKPFGFLGKRAGRICRRAGERAGRGTLRVKRAVKNRLTISRKMFKINRKK